jgi:hypothetical protein
LRSVVREPEFEQSLAALFEIPPEADDYTHAAEVILAENPTMGNLGSMGRDVWEFPMPPVEGKTVSLFYTFDETTVWFLFLRAF